MPGVGVGRLGAREAGDCGTDSGARWRRCWERRWGGRSACREERQVRESSSLAWQARSLAQSIEHVLEPYVDLVDWTKKSDVQREMRRQIKRKLPDALFSKDDQNRVAASLIDLYRAREGR